MTVESPIQACLENQKCLVLGGSGFLGANLCLALQNKALQVSYFSRTPNHVVGVDWIPGDFNVDDDIKNAVSGFDIVFHLVCTSTPASGDRNPLLDAQENLIQTLKLLDACRHSGVKRVVFVSSGGTLYGDASIVPTPEDSAEQPVCAYGISKLSIEKYLALYERLYGLVAISLRVANPYGPLQHSKKQQGAVGVFINKALRSEPIDIWGDGSVVRDYIYVSDVIAALILAAQYSGEYRVFNIGSGVGLSLKSLVAIIDKALDTKIAVRYDDARSVDVSRSILDCTLARRELAWQPTVSLEKGIAKTVEWIRRQI